MEPNGRTNEDPGASLPRRDVEEETTSRRRAVVLGVALTVVNVVAAFLLTAIAVAAAVGLGMELPAPGEPLSGRAFSTMVTISSAGLLGIAALSLGAGRRPIPLRLDRDAWVPAILALVVVWAINVAGTHVMRFTGEPYPGAPTLLEGESRLWLVLAAVVFAPAAEELFFREVVLVRLFRGAPAVAGVVASSLAFGSMHFASGGPTLIVTLTTMGIVLAWLRLRTGSLAPPALVHAANNLAVLLLLD